jgi:biotin transport system substrate-specific component
VLGRQRALTADYTAVDTETGSRSLATGIVGAIVLATLTWVGANIYIPLVPVPVTLQTLFVLLAGSIVGSRYGVLSQFLYVGIGALGLPVFAGGLAGAGVIAGPTGGYLLSFLVAPVVVSRLIQRGNSLAWQFATFTIGTMIIFVLGVSHLAAFYTHDIGNALRVGFLPFVPGAILKIVAAVSIYRSYSALARQRRP